MQYVSLIKKMTFKYKTIVAAWLEKVQLLYLVHVREQLRFPGVCLIYVRLILPRNSIIAPFGLEYNSHSSGTLFSICHLLFYISRVYNIYPSIEADVFSTLALRRHFFHPFGKKDISKHPWGSLNHTFPLAAIATLDRQCFIAFN